MTVLSIRPLTEQDIPIIIDYWLSQDEENLLRMGASKKNLGSPAEFTTRLQHICDTPMEQAKTYFLIWLIDGKPVGYNQLNNILPGEIADIHVHMWDTAHRGRGYGAKLFCMAVLEFYNLFGLNRILAEPRAKNHMPNKMFTNIGFKLWKTYLTKPSTLGLISMVNSYIVDRKTAEDFLRRDHQGV